MKKVCIIVHQLSVGGVEKTVVGEVHEFLRRGYQVHLVTLNTERPETFMGDIPPECERTLIKFGSPFNLSALRSLMRLLKREEPDIVVTQMWFANTVGRIAARLSGQQRRVISFEQNVYDRLNLKSRKQFFVDRVLQRWCRRVAAASKAIAASVIRSGIRSDRVVVIYDSIELAHLTNASPSAVRNELKLGEQFAYLFVGRLVPQKGVDVLIRAFSRQEEGVLLVAGQGLEEDRLKALADELGVRSRIFFLGVRHDVPGLMKAVDCFVLASRLEGLGIVLIEAIACGLPVVATKVDGIVEVVEDKQTGLLVPPDDVQALADAMRSMRETSMRNSLVKDGAERMRERFSIQKHVDDILACFS